MSKKDIKQQLTEATKRVYKFKSRTRQLQWIATKFKYKRKEISAFVLVLTFLSFSFFTLKSSLSYFIAFVKAHTMTVAIVTGSSALSIATASIVIYKVLLFTPTIASSLETPVEVVKEQHQILKPKIVKVIKIDGNEIKGNLLKFNDKFLTIEYQGYTKTIDQKDIYKVVW